MSEKQVNVKRIYFEEGYFAPVFELENGDLKFPVIDAGLLKWFTKLEFNNLVNVKDEQKII